MGIAAAAFFILPDFPRTTTWLTEEERELAVWRLEEDIGQEDWVDAKHQSFKEGLKLAFSDIKTYILMVMLFGIVASGTVTNFFPCVIPFSSSFNLLTRCRTVVKSLKYNDVNTLLLTVPPYVLAVITTFLNSWHAGKSSIKIILKLQHVLLPSSKIRKLKQKFKLTTPPPSRPNRRTLLPHHNPPLLRNLCLYPRSLNDQNSASIRSNDAHGSRRIHRLRRRLSLDIEFAA